MPRGDSRLTIPPPAKGLKSDLPRHLVSDDYIVDGQNVLCRDAKVLVRPGYTEFIPGMANPFAGPALGGIAYKDNDLIRRIFLASPARLAELDGSTWVDRTGTAMTGTPYDAVRMALFQTNTSSRVVFTNNVNRPRIVTAGSNSADIPAANCVCDAAKDVTVAFNRVVFGNIVIDGDRAPSSLLISNYNDPIVYPNLNRVDLTDTPDTIVAVRALNTQAFAVYKEQSQWIGIGQPQVYPFVFELRSQAPGPVSPSAVVVARGVHYYMGHDGDIYIFNGSTTASIGQNVRRTLQNDVFLQYADRVHGYYDDFLNEVWWFYPSVPEFADYPDSAIVFNIDTQAFSTVLRYPTTFSMAMPYGPVTDVMWDSLTGTWETIATTYPTWEDFPMEFHDSNLLISSTASVYRTSLGVTTDDGAAINATFTLPFKEYAGPGQKTRIDAVEPHWKLTDGSRNMAVEVLRTDTLGSDGTPTDAQEFDLSTDERKIAQYDQIESRYVAARHTVDSAHGNDEYRGMTLYIYPRSVT